ncbi:unnamed protein product, partial [Laminaria digitata]
VQNIKADRNRGIHFSRLSGVVVGVFFCVVSLKYGKFCGKFCLAGANDEAVLVFFALAGASFGVHWAGEKKKTVSRGGGWGFHCGGGVLRHAPAFPSVPSSIE